LDKEDKFRTDADTISENANDSLKGRVLEVSLADLQNDPEQGFRKIKLRVEDVAVSHTPRYTGRIWTDFHRARAVSLLSTAWTSPPTSYDLLSENGRLSSRLTSMSTPLTVTDFDCSRLVSPSEPPTRSRRPPTLSLPRSRPSGAR
jgi:hypothetical protein